MGIKYLISSLLVAIASVSFSSNAAVVYVYTGNNYDFLFTSPSMFDTSMSITGSFTVDSKLINVNGDISAQVTSYSFSDGVTTYSDADPEGFTSQFLVNTDSNGNITNWLIDIFDISYYSPNLEPGDIANRIISIGGDQDIAIVSQCDFLVVTCTFTQIDGASTMINPGSWSVVPIPAAIWLFGSGLIGLIGIARRGK